MGLVVPTTPVTVFWNTTDILNFARVLVNDAQGGIDGQDLADDRPYTWPLLNLCYAKLANWLEDSNVESATYKEWNLTLPPSGSYSDPAAQSYLGYDGFVDAAGFRYETPVLPEDLLEPLEVGERVSGQNVGYTPMAQIQGGLGARWGKGQPRRWEFRENALYMLGASSVATDIWIRGILCFPVLVQPTPDNPIPPQIKFARAGEALAYMVAAEFAEIRNAPNAVGLRAKANEQLQIIANKSAKRSNQTQMRRQGYGFQKRRIGSGFGVYGQ